MRIELRRRGRTSSAVIANADCSTIDAGEDDGWTSTYHLFAISLRQDLNRLVAASTMFANQEWEHTALGDRGVKVPDQGG